jgi:glycyl-tRNA synthetase alpha chain
MTYGLERLAMYLQGVENVYDLVWTEWQEGGATRPHHVRRRVPPERGRAVHRTTSSSRTRRSLFGHFADYEAGAKRLMAAQLALPAYEQVLKAAHTFNLLDARGAISVTERAAYIGRIRGLAKAVAQSYFESRERLGFPMLSREAA